MAYRPLLLTSPMLRGPDVVALQKLIAAYDPHPGGAAFVDGIFGPDTKAALIAFQQVQGDRNLGVALPDFQVRWRLPMPADGGGIARPTLVAEPVTGPTAPIYDVNVVAKKPLNWKLWLSLAGLAGFGYVATRKKGWF